MKENKEFKKAVEFFIKANEQFIRSDIYLFTSKVSERCFCGALMNHMNLMNKSDSDNKQYYPNCYADVEYNRNCKNIRQDYQKQMPDGLKDKNITCDIILHSRGQNTNDYIIAIEMKKENNTRSTDSDKNRLKELTKKTKDSGKEYAYGYTLGIFYEISRKYDKVKVEYYKNGLKIESNDLINEFDINKLGERIM